jgi:hypothetical protein
MIAAVDTRQAEVTFGPPDADSHATPLAAHFWHDSQERKVAMESLKITPAALAEMVQLIEKGR